MAIKLKQVDCSSCGGTGKQYDPITTGPALRATREEAGVSREKLATAMEISSTYVYDIETDPRKTLAPELVQRYLQEVAKLNGK